MSYAGGSAGYAPKAEASAGKEEGGVESSVSASRVQAASKPLDGGPEA